MWPLSALGRWRQRLCFRVPAQVAFALLVVGGALTFGCVLEVLGSGVFHASPVASAELPMRCNGYAELCDRRLDEVVFAGAHNAMNSAATHALWPNQDADIASDLEYGIRAFLIDTHYWETEKQLGDFAQQLTPAQRDQLMAAAHAAGGARPGTYLCHMMCATGASDFTTTLRSFVGFLETHPHEVIILDIEDAISVADTEAAFRASGLINYVAVHRPGDPWSTLRQLVERNQRVIVGAERAGPPPEWYSHLYSEAWDTPFKFGSTEEFNCNLNRGAMENALLLVNHWIAKRVPDRADAARANSAQLLMQRVRGCEMQRGRHPNIIAVDFATTGDLLSVVNRLNGVRETDSWTPRSRMRAQGYRPPASAAASGS